MISSFKEARQLAYERVTTRRPIDAYYDRSGYKTESAYLVVLAPENQLDGPHPCSVDIATGEIIVFGPRRRHELDEIFEHPLEVVSVDD